MVMVKGSIIKKVRAKSGNGLTDLNYAIPPPYANFCWKLRQEHRAQFKDKSEEEFGEVKVFLKALNGGKWSDKKTLGKNTLALMFKTYNGNMLKSPKHQKNLISKGENLQELANGGGHKIRATGIFFLSSSGRSLNQIAKVSGHRQIASMLAYDGGHIDQVMEIGQQLGGIADKKGGEKRTAPENDDQIVEKTNLVAVRQELALLEISETPEKRVRSKSPAQQRSFTIHLHVGDGAQGVNISNLINLK